MCCGSASGSCSPRIVPMPEVPASSQLHLLEDAGCASRMCGAKSSGKSQSRVAAFPHPRMCLRKASPPNRLGALRFRSKRPAVCILSMTDGRSLYRVPMHPAQLSSHFLPCRPSTIGAGAVHTPSASASVSRGTRLRCTAIRYGDRWRADSRQMCWAVFLIGFHAGHSPAKTFGSFRTTNSRDPMLSPTPSSC